MSVVITLRENASIKIEGDAILQDHLGNRIETNPEKPIVLCRCGQSAKKPFCDSTHKRCGWVAVNPPTAPVVPVAV